MNKLFREIFCTPTDEAQDMAEDILCRNGYTPERGRAYVYGPGDIPVLLVAHTDTVHRTPVRDVYVDSAKRVVWSPQGIGADDRAGVYGIALLLARGLRPHVLFPDEEESGGHGAREASHVLYPAVHCLIELDRKGANDAVTYQCANPKWDRWLERRGWCLDWGTYTDIVELMPFYGVCGANLSIGYYNQHTTAEYLNMNQLERTVRRVEKILRDPPKRPFPYREEASIFLTKTETEPLQEDDQTWEDYWEKELWR